MKKIWFAALLLLTITTSDILAFPSIFITETDLSEYPEVKAKYLSFDENFEIHPGVSPSSFSVTDNGVAVPVLSAECQEQDLINEFDLVVTFDLAMNNGSESSNFEKARSIIGHLFDIIDTTKTKTALSSFEMVSFLEKDFTINRSELHTALDRLKPRRGSYFDVALSSYPAGALNIVSQSESEKAILLITDSYGDVDADKVIEMANENSTRVYCITLGEELPDGLKRISDETGGAYIEHLHGYNSDIEIAALLNALMKNYKPCTLSWESPQNCIDDHLIEVYLLPYSSDGATMINMPENLKPFIQASPEYLRFASILIPETATDDVTITAVNSDIHIDSLSLTDPHFSIIPATDIKDYDLIKGSSHKVSVKFTPTDSAIVFSKLIVHSNACDGYEILITGGFPNTPPNDRTIDLVTPEAGETLLIDDTVSVEWQGLLPIDVIQLEYTIDNGKSWDTLAKNVNGLKHNWIVPDEPSDSCLVRAIQLWPNNVGRTMDLRHPQGVNSALFSVDYDFVVTSCKDSIVRLWNSNNGKVVREYKGHTGQVTWAEFSNDNKYIASSGTDSIAIIWDRETGDLVHKLEGHTREVRSVVFSPDSRKVITSSADGKAIIWDVETGNQDKIIEQSTLPLYFATFDPVDGSRALVAGVEKDVKLWNIQSGVVEKRFSTPNGYYSHSAFSADGSKLVISSQLGGATVWDVASETQLSAVAHLDTSGSSSAIMFSAFDATGDTILTSGFDQKVKMWDANTGDSVVTFLEHTSTVKTAVMNFDGARVLTSSWDSTAKIWNRKKRDLQMDSTDGVFSIRGASLLAFNIDFGGVVYGELADSIVTTFLINENDYTVKVYDFETDGLAANDFTILKGMPPFEIDPGDTVSIELRFTPGNIGERLANLNIKIPGTTVTAELKGIGIEPGLRTIADYIDFGQVELGDYKDSTITMIVRNNRDDAIEITDISVKSPDTEHFDIISGEGPVTLNPDQGHEMIIRFIPERLGRINGYLEFEYDGEASPARIFLYGEGVPLIIDTIKISGSDINAKAGDIVAFPIKIENISERGVPPGVSGFEARLRYNATLLEPQETSLRSRADSIDENQRFMFVTLPVDSDGDGILAMIPFKAALGNATETDIMLEDIAQIGRGKLVIYEEKGSFSLEGVCQEGGARLFDGDSRLTLTQNMPNPVKHTAKIEFELFEKGHTALYVYDIEGNKVLTLLSESLNPGMHSVDFNVESLSSGVYYYVLETPTRKISRRMHVEK